MEEAIDKDQVIYQLQLENEMLRRYMGTLTEVKEAISIVPAFVQELVHKAMMHKSQLLIGLMAFYFTIAITFMIYDRFKHE